MTNDIKSRRRRWTDGRGRKRAGEGRRMRAAARGRTGWDEGKGRRRQAATGSDMRWADAARTERTSGRQRKLSPMEEGKTNGYAALYCCLDSNLQMKIGFWGLEMPPPGGKIDPPGDGAADR
jgi:hypothetical protein